MAPKRCPIPLSGGDRKALKKELVKSRAMTKRTVDAIVPGVRASIVYETDLEGFGIAPNGSLSWFVEYRPGAGGRRVAKKRMVIEFREFTPEQARQAAKGNSDVRIARK
jgi:hypothetical protein